MPDPQKRRPKRIIFCFDGTWNRLSVECPTNVVLLAQMIEPLAPDGTPQVVFYNEGIGANRWWPVRVYEGAFGQGMLRIMREAYRFLIFNYEPGDEIFAFGFSRGAYSARSFIGLIRHAGILDIASVTQIDEAFRIYREAPTKVLGAESEEGFAFRAKYCTGVCVSADDRKWRKKNLEGFDPAAAPLLEIKYLGVWDTVRALGLPDFLPGSGWFNRKYVFHDDYLSSKIKAARHAVALDEQRPTFRATLFGRDQVDKLNARNQSKKEPPTPAWKQLYQERWFPGVHGAVGGGGPHRGLSDGALEWVLEGARQRGLVLRDRRSNVAYALRPNPYDNLQNDPPKGWRAILARIKGWFGSPRQGPTSLNELALATLRRWHAEPTRLAEGKRWRPGALAALAPLIDQWENARPGTGAWLESDLEDYVVERGDTLSKLAKERLGDALRWPELYAINRDRLDNPDSLPIGLTIRLPRKQT